MVTESAGRRPSTFIFGIESSLGKTLIFSARPTSNSSIRLRRRRLCTSGFRHDPSASLRITSSWTFCTARSNSS